MFSWPRLLLEVSDQLHAPAALPPEEWASLRLGGPQNRSWRYGEAKSSSSYQNSNSTPYSTSPEPVINRINQIISRYV
jgi:hypothetical protein